MVTFCVFAGFVFPRWLVSVLGKGGWSDLADDGWGPRLFGGDLDLFSDFAFELCSNLCSGCVLMLCSICVPIYFPCFGLVRSSPPAPRTGSKIDPSSKTEIIGNINRTQNKKTMGTKFEHKFGNHIEIPRNIQNGVLWAPPQPNTDSGFWGWVTGSGRQGPTGPSTEWVGSCGPPRTRQVGASLADTAVLALAESKQPPTAATQRVHGSGPLKVAYFWKSGSPATVTNTSTQEGGPLPTKDHLSYIAFLGRFPRGRACLDGCVCCGAGAPRF